MRGPGPVSDSQIQVLTQTSSSCHAVIIHFSIVASMLTARSDTSEECPNQRDLRDHGRVRGKKDKKLVFTIKLSRHQPLSCYIVSSPWSITSYVQACPPVYRLIIVHHSFFVNNLLMTLHTETRVFASHWPPLRPRTFPP